MKATEYRFRLVLFTMLYEVVPSFETVDVIVCCDRSNESCCEQYFPAGAIFNIMLYIHNIADIVFNDAILLKKNIKIA